MADIRFIFGVDLDGVCADFYGALRPIVAEWFGVESGSLTEEVSYGLAQWGIDSIDTYNEIHRFAVTQRNLFADLKPIDGAPAALRRLSAQNIRIRIITHRLFIKHFHQLAVQQTTEWLDHHGIPYWDLCFMKDKAAVGADLYIEDSPGNVEALRADRHPTIVFTNSTNRDVPPPRANSWAEAEELVMKEFEKWRKKREKSSRELSGG
jgi:5'(3')-deoxyribonucleotidase